MAKPKKKGVSKAPQKTSSNWMMLGGIAVAIVAIIAVGVVMFNQPQQASAGESASVAADEPTATPADRTVRYIGPESNPEEVNEALAGKLAVPAVVFFHADW